MRTDPPSETDSLQAECHRLEEALALAERERQLLGYEFHDGVVQDLTAAAMRLEAAGRTATFASQDSQESYTAGLRLLQEAIANSRRLIRGVAAVEYPAAGFCNALKRLVEKFRSDHGLTITVSCEVEDPKLPDSMQQLLIRIAQESLHNAWKHSQAKNVEVRVSKNDEKLELSIADDGIGFDPARVSPDRFGLEGIRSRAKALGASLLFDTAPNHGTRVVVQLTPPPTV